MSAIGPTLYVVPAPKAGVAAKRTAAATKASVRTRRLSDGLLGRSSATYKGRMRRALLAVAVLAAGCGGRAAIHGPQLVYAVPTSFSGSHSWIWRARPDGTHRARLTRGHGPQLAPNGRLVAYTRAKDELYVVPISGGRPRVLRQGAGYIAGFVWSPTSGRIAVVHTGSLVLVD